MGDLTPIDLKALVVSPKRRMEARELAPAPPDGMADAWSYKLDERDRYVYLEMIRWTAESIVAEIERMSNVDQTQEPRPQAIAGWLRDAATKLEKEMKEGQA